MVPPRGTHAVVGTNWKPRMRTWTREEDGVGARPAVGDIRRRGCTEWGMGVGDEGHRTQTNARTGISR